MKTVLQYILTTIVLGYGAFLVYQPHIENPLPLLADEYVHISLANQLLNEGVLPFQNPYIASETPHTNYESGFHFLLTFLFLLIPGDPILIYKYFATIFFIINGLLLFQLVKLWSSNYTSAVLSVLFFGTITSTDGLLAHQYFVPLTVGTSLLLLSHIFFYKFLSGYKKRHLFFLGASLVAAAITYPPTLFFFGMTAGVYVLTMEHGLATHFQIDQKRLQWFFVIITLLVVGLFLWILSALHLLGEIVFDASWSLLYSEYSLLFFFGIVPNVFALIGLWHLLHVHTIANRILFCWFIFSLLSIYAFYLFGYSILVPLPRLFFFYLISVSILAGYGASALIAKVQSQINIIFKAGIVLIICFATGAHIYETTQKTTTLPTILTPTDYETLVEFANNYPSDAVAIADALTSVAIHPIAGNPVLNVLNSNIGGGDSNAVRQFLAAPCPEKKQIFEQFTPYLQNASVQRNPFFVISRSPQNCDFLRLLPESSANLYLYTLQTGTLSEFQHKNRVARIPSVAVVAAARPPETITEQSAILELLSGNTIESTNWIEHYYPNGTMTIMNNEGFSYSGVWNITDTFYCYYYPLNDESGCRSIKKTGGKIEFYMPDGTYSSSGRWLPGNPFNLQ